jgi:hypothetical protein
MIVIGETPQWLTEFGIATDRADRQVSPLDPASFLCRFLFVGIFSGDVSRLVLTVPKIGASAWRSLRDFAEAALSVSYEMVGQQIVLQDR